MLEMTMIREIEDGTERFKTASALFTLARRDAATRAERKLMENGISLQYATERVWTTVGELKEQLRDGLEMKPITLVFLTDRLLNESCHRFLFGTDAVTELPRIESALAETMINGTAEEREAISTLVDRLFAYDDARSWLLDPVNLPALERTRIQTLCADRQVAPHRLLGKNEYSIFQVSIKIAAEQMISPREMPLNPLMYLTVMLNTSVDYFLAADYTEHTALRCFGAPESDVIEDKDVIYTLGKFIRLSPLSREKVLLSLQKGALLTNA